MKSQHCHSFILILLFILSLRDDVTAQCSQPEILSVDNFAPYGAYHVVYTNWQQAGTYYIEYGPAGFTPGTTATAGPGGTVLICGWPNGVEPVSFSGIPQNVDCYVRLYCNNSTWTPNSNVFSFALGGALCPAIRPVPNQFATSNMGFNIFSVPGIFSTCGMGYGEEWRWRFDCPDTSIYQLVISGNYIDGPSPQFAMKELNTNTSVWAYNCQSPSSSSGQWPYYFDTYTLGPLNKGTVYDLLFDSNDTVPYYISLKLECPGAYNITTSNITQGSIDISWSCACTDSLLLEYGFSGFVPGAGATAGVGGTIVAPVQSPFTLTGLTPFTAYDVYFRSACGGHFSPNKKKPVKTSKDCSQQPVLICGGISSFQYFGPGAARGAWDLNSCGVTDSSEEMIFQFTPSQTGMYQLNVYDLYSNHNGYFFQTRYYYKNSASGCNDSGWNCFGSSNFSNATFTADTLTFGPLTAGVTYYLAADGNSYGSPRSFRYDFQLLCLNTCNGPDLTAPLNVGFNSALINTACNSCFANGMIEYGPVGFTPGTGNAAGAGGTLITGITFPYLLSGLTIATSYDVYARSDCNGSGLGFSVNSGPETINTCAGAPVSIASAATLICAGDSITLHQVGGLPGATGQYIWYTGGCGSVNLGTGDSITVAPIVNTTYYVRIQSSCGATNCASILIQVQSVNITGNTTFCQGQSTVLNAGPGWSNYVWLTGQTTQNIVVNTPGVYTVIVTGPTGCTTSDSITVMMLPAPIVTVTALGPTSFCQGGSVTLEAPLSLSGWQWYRYLTALAGANSPSITVATPGLYYCIGDSAGCSGQSNNITVTVPCISLDPPVDRESLLTAVTNQTINVFPNPGNGLFSVVSPVNGLLEIFNCYGELILSKKVSIAATGIDISNYAEGVYTITINDGTTLFREKIIMLR